MNTPYWFSNLAYWSAQVALLALAAGFLPYIFKIRQPRVLLIYWRALIAVSLLLPFVQPYRPPPATASAIVMSNQEFARDFPNFKFDQIPRARPVSYWYVHKFEIIAQIIGLIILAGIAARFTILALGLLKLRQFRRASSPIANHAASSAVLDEMRVRVNTGGEFRLSSDVDSPVTFGLTAPVILLPERFPTLDAQYQSAIACHELLHVRRQDWAHHLSEEILRAALWFHPAIAWLISRIRLSREQVVDLEVVRLTDARKPYLEALLEFTNSRSLATAIPAPPFLVERQLAERVALMLKEVRMSRTRLIASLTVIAACLAVVATLAVWTFPLKAAPRLQQAPSQRGIIQGVPGGVQGGVIGGVPDGEIIGVPGGVTNGVPGGIAGGAPTQGVKDGVSSGVKTNGPATITDSYVGPTPRDSGALFGPTILRKLPLGVASATPQPAPKIVVTDIKFVGQVHDADAVRARVIRYSQAKNWDATNPDWLDELAEVGVRGDFQDRGYFEVNVDGVKSQVLDSTAAQQLVVATFNIKEGDQFRAGEFTFLGFDPARGPVIPVSDLREQFHLQTGDILNVDELRHGIGRIFQLYGNQGYIDFVAKPSFSIDRPGRTVAMALTLTEGIQYHVASFTVRGLNSDMTASFESQLRPGSVANFGLLRQLVAQGNAASGANVSFETGVPVTRHIEARTVDIVLDFPVKQPPSPTPSNANDSRFIGKFQIIPPPDASSSKVQNIPPAVKSAGVFETVTPSQQPGGYRGPISQVNSGQTYRAGQDGVTMPKCEYCPKPEYTQEARDANIQGTAYLQVTVLTTGRAGEIKLIKGFEKSLDEQAIKVVREEWTFKPATDRNGNLVDVTVPVEIVFQLFGPPQPTPPSTGRSGAASPATAPLTPNETIEAKIFKSPVTDNGASTPFYMGQVEAKTLYAPQPELPRLARQANVHGPVTLNIVVNTEGKVIVVEYVKGPAMVVQAAIDTVRNWIIKGTHDGAPVTFQISVEVSFSGDNK